VSTNIYSRKDPNTSKHVEDAIELFKKKGMWNDSIVIMNSDHGYPDPSTGLTTEIMRKYSHDMIITEDNIKVPLIIKYPGCPEGKKIESVVRIADVFHTIIDYLKIPIINKNKINYSNSSNGSSLLGVINGQDKTPRVARIDTRLTAAFGRVSALRDDNYKYIYYAEEDKEDFYNIVNDPFELNNIIGSKDPDILKEINRLRELYLEQENHIFNYHLSQLEKNIQSELKIKFPNDAKKHSIKKVIITFNALTPVAVAESLIKNLKKYFINIEINLLIQRKLKSKYDNIGFNNIFTLKDLTSAQIKHSDMINEKYDLVIYLTENSAFRFVNNDIVKVLKQIKSKEFIMMDYNFKIYSRLLSKWIFPLKRFIKRNWRYYKDEPRLFPIELWKFIRLGFRMYILGKTKQTFFAEEIKISRDSKLKESGFNSDELLEDIWDDRISDDNKRDEIKKDFLKDKQ